ncbi:MAG: AMP-binding protein, partial [Actinomycetota bacterium]|nr:AMP-binding protein [Actinomycetota bacterium]
MNFARDVIDAGPRGARAIVAIDAAGIRRDLSFGEVAERSARLAGTLAERGVVRGDVVTTVIGSTPDWVLALVACFRLGAVALPCTEQLRAGDLRARLESVPPRLVVASERNVQTVTEGGFDGPLLGVPDEALFDAPPAPAVELDPEEPALVTFTSGTAGEPKPIRHGQRYLEGQRVQADHWLGARPGELVWCTAATGWSKSARNAFIAPWLRGAAAVLEDRSFEPHERLATAEREGVNVLCMTPTEYRAVAGRAGLRRLPALRHAVAAGEPLDPGVVHDWRSATGVEIHDGYGQTETGAICGMPLGEPVRHGRSRWASRKKVGTVAGSAHSSPSSSQTSNPGSAFPIDPGRTGSPSG